MKKTLQAAAMAAKWWEPPRDALDTMTLGAADLESLKPYKHRCAPRHDTLNEISSTQSRAGASSRKTNVKSNTTQNLTPTTQPPNPPSNNAIRDAAP